ncbi:MAG TPA: multidrug effflux MFS transporter [Rhabdochlamydiaceae bacterium]|nr:multidrug effflux MFS transporter [Rhabdochlamydiaceae bacterium]
MQQRPSFFILLFLVSFASVGAVLFTPALPSIASFFQVSAGKVQLTMTSFLLGYAFGQLPYGPLANRFGRKVTLYIGISLAILGSLLCAFSSPLDSFELLVFARFLQALGASVGLKVSFTMIADVYSQTEATKMLSGMMIAFAVMPGIAIAIGGWLTQLFNWESCFYFLVLFGIFILWISTKLPETAKSLDHHALNISSITAGYAEAFKNKLLVISGLIMGCCTATIYVFASKAPFIGISLIGLSPDVFGNYNLIPPVGMLLGALVSAKIVGKFSLLRILFAAAATSLIVAFTMLIPFLVGKINPTVLFFPMLLIYFAQALILANASSYGLANAKNKSNGSAVMNFVNLSTSVAAVLLLEFIYPESAILMPLSFMIFSFIALLLWFKLKKAL